jgi:hypothetical protein
MYVEITLDCQTKTAHPSCDYCIANKECQLRESLKNYEKNYGHLDVKLSLPPILCSNR